MKLLVTGGAGFMGSSFIRHMLSSHDVSITTIDALTYASDMDSLSSVVGKKNFKFIKGDISERDLVFDIVRDERPDVIVNFAAETHVDNSIKDSSLFLRSNVLGTASLLDAVNRFSIPRFHQISTDEVYGDLPLDSADSFYESSPLRPNNPYSATKASADLLALSYHRTYGTPVTISRSVNNYGPFQNREKLIPMVIDRVMKGERIPVYSKGENIRSWIYVEDHSRAVEKILLSGRIGEIYNISSGYEERNIDVVKYIIRKLGAAESLIEFSPDRPGHDKRYSLDTEKMESELGFKPSSLFMRDLIEPSPGIRRKTAKSDNSSSL